MEFQIVVKGEVNTLEEAMVMVYKDISKIQYMVALILAIQAHSKERVVMLKDGTITLYSMHESFIKYPRAPVVVPKKDWITMEKHQGPGTHQHPFKGQTS